MSDENMNENENINPNRNVNPNYNSNINPSRRPNPNGNPTPNPNRIPRPNPNSPKKGPVKGKKPFVNTSGQGESAKVPLAVKNKFNWGAFLLNWIWGIGNKSYITLLFLILGCIPLVNLGVLIWFGVKGNEWAWRNKRFKSIPEFHEIQKKWAIAGLIVYILSIVLLIMFYAAIISVFLGTNNMGSFDTNSLNQYNY